MKSTERDAPSNRLRPLAPAKALRCAITHHRRHWCCGYGDDEGHASTLRGLGSQDVPEESRAARRGPARVSQATGRPRPPSLAPWPGTCVPRGLREDRRVQVDGRVGVADGRRRGGARPRHCSLPGLRPGWRGVADLSHRGFRLRRVHLPPNPLRCWLRSPFASGQRTRAHALQRTPSHMP